MKDEFNGIKIVELVRLKSKMYSLVSIDDKEVSKTKGVNKKLKHKEYVDVLFNKKVVNMIGTYIFKISLSCFDDQRYVLGDGVNLWLIFIKT